MLESRLYELNKDLLVIRGIYSYHSYKALNDTLPFRHNIRKMYSYILLLYFINEREDNGPNLKEFPIDDKDVLFSACLMVSHHIMFIRFVYYHSY